MCISPNVSCGVTHVACPVVGSASTDRGRSIFCGGVLVPAFEHLGPRVGFAHLLQGQFKCLALESVWLTGGKMKGRPLKQTPQLLHKAAQFPATLLKTAEVVASLWDYATNFPSALMGISHSALSGWMFSKAAHRM